MTEQTRQVGDVIRIKPEYQDAGDASLTWRIKELRGDRLVATVDEQAHMGIQPTYLIHEHMLEAKISYAEWCKTPEAQAGIRYIKEVTQS